MLEKIKEIKSEACDGKENLVRYDHDALIDWGIRIDAHEEPTKECLLDVYKTRATGKKTWAHGQDVMESLGNDLESLCLTQHQIRKAVTSYVTNLSKRDMALFLTKDARGRIHLICAKKVDYSVLTGTEVETWSCYIGQAVFGGFGLCLYDRNFVIVPKMD